MIQKLMHNSDYDVSCNKINLFSSHFSFNNVVAAKTLNKQLHVLKDNIVSFKLPAILGSFVMTNTCLDSNICIIFLLLKLQWMATAITFSVTSSITDH